MFIVTLYLRFLIPNAVRHEGMLQKQNIVSTMHKTCNSWLKDVSRIFESTMIDIELEQIPQTITIAMMRPPIHHFHSKNSFKMD